jgi:SPP1 family predicted phage head-tail adaptor
MKTGNLKYNFTLLISQRSKNSFGEVINTFIEKPVRGYLKRNTGKKEMVNNEVVNNDIIVFKIRNHYVINESDRIKFNDNEYIIQNILPDYNRLYLEITATKVNK